MKKKYAECYLFYEYAKWQRIIKLIRLVREQKYDVILVHHEGIGIYILYLFLMLLFPEKKYLKYLHCSYEKDVFFDGDNWKARIHYHLLKQALFRSDSLIAVSEYVKASYCQEFRVLDKSVDVALSRVFNSYPLAHSVLYVELE